ncbi:MAG: hypothetical protein J5J06_13375 [Phycisphaerae bacterium]|nr:hypothetical protein [Phycisphaerae bacterium]
MRRTSALALLAIFVLFCNGCVAVVGNKGQLKTCPTTSAVALNGQIYLVDHCTRRVKRIDPVVISNAETVTQIEVTEAEEGDED